MGPLSLKQTQVAGTGQGFGAAADLQFVEDVPVVPLDAAQSEEEPRRNLTVRES